MLVLAMYSVSRFLFLNCPYMGTSICSLRDNMGTHTLLCHSYGGMSRGVSMQITEFTPCVLPLLRRPFAGAYLRVVRLAFW